MEKGLYVENHALKVSCFPCKRLPGSRDSMGGQVNRVQQEEMASQHMRLSASRWCPGVPIAFCIVCDTQLARSTDNAPSSTSTEVNPSIPLSVQVWMLQKYDKVTQVTWRLHSSGLFFRRRRTETRAWGPSPVAQFVCTPTRPNPMRAWVNTTAIAELGQSDS